MSLQVALLEDSFAAIAPQRDQLAEVFYENLFRDFPETEAMFRDTDMTEQKLKLISSLQLVVGNLTHADVLEPALEYLGQSHVEYGVREEHYPAVGQTLLKSLRQVAGDVWTDELDEAWADAYREIVRIMLQGATQVV